MMSCLHTNVNPWCICGNDIIVDGDLDTEDGEDGDTPVLRDAVVDAWGYVVRGCPRQIWTKKAARSGKRGVRRTFATRLEKPRAPLDFSAPPNVMSFPMAASQSALHEPVSAEVVSILGDLVPLPGRFLLRCSVHFVCTYMYPSIKINRGL